MPERASGNVYRVDRADIESKDPFVDQLVDPLNRVVDAVQSIQSNSFAFTYHETSIVFVTPLNYKFRLKAARRPNMVLLASATDSSGVALTSTVKWEYDGQGSVNVVDVPGLTPGISYTVVFALA